MNPQYWFILNISEYLPNSALSVLSLAGIFCQFRILPRKRYIKSGQWKFFNFKWIFGDQKKRKDICLFMCLFSQSHLFSVHWSLFKVLHYCLAWVFISFLGRSCLFLVAPEHKLAYCLTFQLTTIDFADSSSGRFFQIWNFFLMKVYGSASHLVLTNWS